MSAAFVVIKQIKKGILHSMVIMYAIPPDEVDERHPLRIQHNRATLEIDK